MATVNSTDTTLDALANDPTRAELREALQLLFNRTESMDLAIEAQRPQVVRVNMRFSVTNDDLERLRSVVRRCGGFFL